MQESQKNARTIDSCTNDDTMAYKSEVEGGVVYCPIIV